MPCGALQEAGGDTERAVEILRVKGQASAAKRSGRATSEGTVASYVHSGGSVGVLVEVRCETDFVARNEDFQEFAREVALHAGPVAAAVRLRRRDPDPARARPSAPCTRRRRAKTASRTT